MDPSHVVSVFVFRHNRYVPMLLVQTLAIENWFHPVLVSVPTQSHVGKRLSILQRDYRKSGSSLEEFSLLSTPLILFAR